MAMHNNDYTGPYHVDLPAWISCAPFEALLAMEIVTAKKGSAILRMPFLKSFAQGAGLMHGGALVSLADTAVVMAIKSVLEPGTHFATISLETRFKRPVTKGVVEARAAIVERNGFIIKGACELFDETDRKVAEFYSEFKIARDAGKN
jgi:acyl-CoA thioesterase